MHHLPCVFDGLRIFLALISTTEAAKEKKNKEMA